MSELRVVSVIIKDVLGAKEFNLEPGKITQLRGKNGSGKSTALQALQSALAGGNLAKLARVGEPGETVEPEVVLVLEGAGSEAYRVERKADKVRVRARVGDTAAFEDVGRPQTWLRSLWDPQGANPVAFLMAKDADRALMLLEALPLKFDRAALLEEMGVQAASIPPVPIGLHPLEEIGLIRDAVFGQRTGVNRDEKSATQAADQLRRSIPAVLPEDPEEAIQFLQGEVGALATGLAADEEKAAAAEREAVRTADAEAAQEEQRIEAAFKAKAARLRSDHEGRAATLRREVEEKIAHELANVEKAISDRKEADEAALRKSDEKAAAARQSAGAARARADQALAATRNTLNAKQQQLAVLREQAKASAQAHALDGQATRFENEAARLVEESDRLTKAIATLDAYRRRMAEDLPIEGLEIEGKEIRVHGIPYDQLNTQQRVDIAVRVACLRAKDQRLPVVFVDGAEALDRVHFDLLVERLREAGVQAFLGRVEDSELQVVTDKKARA